MKPCLVLYYSHTGNSRFLAEKIARELPAELRAVRPLIQSVLLLYLFSLARWEVPIDVSDSELQPYAQVVILGPIWGGLLISPLRSLLKQALRTGKIIHFAVSCESPDEKKQGKYGYAQVLQAAEQLGKGQVRTTEAFPSALVEAANRPARLTEKIKLTEANFSDRLKARLTAFVERVAAAG